MGIGERRACSATAATVFAGLGRFQAQRAAHIAGWTAGYGTGTTRPETGIRRHVASGSSTSAGVPRAGQLALPTASELEDASKAAMRLALAAGEQSSRVARESTKGVATTEGGAREGREDSAGAGAGSGDDLASLVESLLVPGLDGGPLGWAGDWISAGATITCGLPPESWSELAIAVVGRAASCLL